MVELTGAGLTPTDRSILDYQRREAKPRGPDARFGPVSIRARMLALILGSFVALTLAVALLLQLPPWLFFGGTSVILALAALLLPGHLRRERAARRLNHCAACGYDLRHSAERCPECGADLPEELARRRRVAAELRARREGASGRVDIPPAPPLASPAPDPSAATETSPEESPA